MLEKYPRLVETVIEFKRYSRRILAEHKGKVNQQNLVLFFFIGQEYTEAPDARVIDMANGYSL